LIQKDNKLKMEYILSDISDTLASGTFRKHARINVIGIKAIFAGAI